MAAVPPADLGWVLRLYAQSPVANAQRLCRLTPISPAPERQPRATYVSLIHAVGWKQPTRPRVRREELVRLGRCRFTILIPYRDLPVMECGRSKAILWFADNVSLLAALDFARVPEKIRFIALLRTRCERDAVRGLPSLLDRGV